MSSQAALGQKALEAKDYSSAIKYYTEALKSSKSPLWLTQRSTAYQRYGQHELALRDAEDAILQAMSRGRRELMAAAQMRRAIALYGLERYGDARLCFTWVRKLNEKEKGLGMWQAKVVQEYEKLDEGAEGRKAMIQETPSKVEEAVTPVPVANTARSSGIGKAVHTTSTPSAAATVAPLIQTPKDKIRHEWFQSGSKVTITIFAKNVPKDQADIRIGRQSLEVSFPTGSGSNYDYTLLPLFSEIDADQSTYSVTPHKIEISLHKVMSGLKWAALEGSHAETTGSSKEDQSAQATKSLPPVDSSVTVTKAPAYPTSSRTGAKNWDAVAADALMKEKKKEAKDGDPDAPILPDDDIDEEGDPLQGFFKSMYKNADPDTKRAMMKSYVESNGTALSTNWEDVGSKTVPINPPDGIEAKKWNA